MSNFSATSNPASSLQPPDGHVSMNTDQRNGGISVDMKKRLFQLESEKEFLKEDNVSLRASKLELEDKLRDQRRLLEDKDEINSKLERDGKSLAEKLKMSEENCEKWKEKYETLREGSDSGERKWKARFEEIRMKCWQLEVDKKSLEMDLTGDRTAELTEKLKAAQRLLEEKDITISEMMIKIQNLEREKDVTISEMKNKIQNLEREKNVTVSEMKNKIQNLEREKNVTVSEMMKENDNLKREKLKIEEELGHRVLNLEESVEERTHCTDSESGKEKTSGGIRIALGCNVQDKGRVSSKRSGPIPTGISTLIDRKQENMEADEQLAGPVIKKKPYSPKPTDVYIVDISDDEEENKQTPSLSTPSNAERPPAAKRKSEAATTATCYAEMQDGAVKRCNSSELWKDAKQMLEAFKANDELCMKSVCALYRKHKSLGVWKNRSDENKGFQKALIHRGVFLGQFLTDGDPEGRMKKSVADLVCKDPKLGLLHCRFIAKEHLQVLFEIYINNQDPFFTSSYLNY